MNKFWKIIYNFKLTYSRKTHSFVLFNSSFLKKSDGFVFPIKDKMLEIGRKKKNQLNAHLVVLN